MKVDKTLITSLIKSALSADYTGVRRIGNAIVKSCVEQKDIEGAKLIQSLLRKRGVPLQAAGYVESLPRDSGSSLPLVEEGSWPTTPIMLNNEIGYVITQFIEDAGHIELLTQKGLSTRLGLLLYGPPGTGKSLLAAHIAASLKRTFYIVRLDSLISSRLGETAKNIREVFDFIPTRNAILFLDEMDAIAKIRDDRNELGELKRVVNTVLQGLDSLTNDVITIAATNHPHLLDPAIFRRFPYKAELGYPDKDVSEKLWLHFLFDENNKHKREAEILSYVSTGLSGADIENIALAARRRAILSSNTPPSLAQILRAITHSQSGSPCLLDNTPLNSEDKKALSYLLKENGNLNQVEIAEIIDVSRQTVNRYLKEDSNG